MLPAVASLQVTVAKMVRYTMLMVAGRSKMNLLAVEREFLNSLYR